MQFVMGLNESYDVAVSNIIMMEPIPSLNKTCFMIARIEMQRDIASGNVNTSEASALAVSTRESQKTLMNSNTFNNRKDVKKSDRKVIWKLFLVDKDLIWQLSQSLFRKNCRSF
ncbi:uncharacterized protein G2W53_003658 [Senna tora]|uniref:Uncharacterized protein n=1 Tax=Senna tora TaxID=362788 RepID=A0A834XAJ2_9FABA|nr:uncharacterized protein G2W53_003658 [Senna tora]